MSNSYETTSLQELLAEEDRLDRIIREQRKRIDHAADIMTKAETDIKACRAVMVSRLVEHKHRLNGLL